jgi:hypothetical protein
MTRPADYNTLGSEFNEFLYAPIAEESNGMALSVLSALARLGLDPWEQAAQWARLPGETATRNLASLIAALPAGPAARPDPGPLAARLIALLPRRNERMSSAKSSAGSPAAAPANPQSRSVAYMVVYLVLTIFLLCSQWIFGARPGITAAHTPTTTSGPQAPASPAAQPAGQRPAAGP